MRPERITEAQARQIIERAAAGEARKVLAYDFGVSYSAICDVLAGRRHAGAAPELLDRVRRRPSKKTKREVGLYVAAGGKRKDAARIFGLCRATVTKYVREYQAQETNNHQTNKGESHVHIYP